MTTTGMRASVGIGLGAEHGQELVSAHARHPEVDQDELRPRTAPDRVQRSAGVADGVDRVAEVHQHLREQLAVIDEVVHDHDPG